MNLRAEQHPDAECLYTKPQIEEALDHMAAAINEKLCGSNPLVLCVMVGGLVTCGHLLTRLNFPLQLDYIHASRYAAARRGGELRWLADPQLPLTGRVILIVDDIFDEGITLKAIVAHCHHRGAKAVYSAVLLNKLRQRAATIRPDFHALEAPDRFVFGYGLDDQGYGRNLPAIYALPSTDDIT